jgi:multiple sugar transport system substrate-binding protein
VALGTLILGTTAQAEVLFWSTQAQPVEEGQKMRESVLAGFEGGADNQASEAGPWLTRF